MNRLLPFLAAAVACALASTGATADPVARAQAETYVRNVTDGPRSQAVARWREPICPLVAGLPRDQAEALLERLSEDARKVGAPLAPSECRPNLFIVTAGDPETLLRAWAARDSDLFGVRREADLERVISVDRPVRVWRRISSAPSYGPGAAAQSLALVGNLPSASKPVLNGANHSHLTGNAQRVIWGAAVVLGPEVNRLKIGQLADYIALATFAEVNLDADVGEDPSILALFRAGAAAPAGLSASDEAYLRALYAVRPDLVSQRAAISGRMALDARP